MRQAPPHDLWIGHAGDGRSFRRLADLGVRAVVQLAAEEPALEAPREFTLMRFPLVDGGDNDPALLTLAIDSIVALLIARIPVLVCCGAGMSRSPAVCAAAMATVEVANPEVCLRRLADLGPVDVAPDLWAEIRHILTNRDIEHRSGMDRSHGD